MKKVFGFLSLLFCLMVVAQSLEVLQNPDMDGCENGNGSPVSSWTGGISYVMSGYAMFFSNEATADICFAPLNPSSPQDTITQIINVPTTGFYDFSMSFACLSFGFSYPCTMTLSINNQNIPLNGATNIPSTNPTPYIPATALGIPLTAGTYPLVIKYVYAGGTVVALTSASLKLSGPSTPPPPASGSGDPHMIGFQGQRYDFIGRPGQIVNLLTDPEIQLNTKLGMQKQSEVMYFDGPVMMEMAFMTRGHTVMINAGGYKKEEIGFVTVDGVLLPLGDSFLDGILSVVFSPLNALAKDLGMVGDNDHIVAQVVVKLEGLFEFRVFMIENGRDPKNPEHWIFQIPRRFLDFNASLLDLDRRPHGVLGQTAAPLSKERSVGEWTIEGKDQDYVVKDGLTGTQFAFNQFN